ncbi:MAG: hypothetical protein Q8N26_35045 [Myxococcales bacterium]|nr:hypothetical protein [Myxococcales bacterium]
MNDKHFDWRADSLPEIDAVEVVDLEEVEPLTGSDYMSAATLAPTVRVSGSAAKTIAALWRSLPAGSQARCHDPPFGLRFFLGDKLVAEASLCWMCNNVVGGTWEGTFWFEFDGEAPGSLELLAALRTEIGKPQ